MAWTPSANASAAASGFMANLADVGITAADTYLPKALFDAYLPYMGASSGTHSLGTTVNWSLGSGQAGHYAFGAGCPSGAIVSITGCDEGGTISFAGGANTAAGEMFRIYFGSTFPSAPAVTFAGADANGASVLFLNKVYATANSGSFALVTATAIGSGGGAFHWVAKGRT